MKLFRFHKITTPLFDKKFFRGVASICQAMGYSYKSLIISLVRQIVVLLPAAYLLAELIGLDGIWWAFPIAETIGFVLCMGILKKMLAGLSYT